MNLIDYHRGTGRVYEMRREVLSLHLCLVDDLYAVRVMDAVTDAAVSLYCFEGLVGSRILR